MLKKRLLACLIISGCCILSLLLSACLPWAMFAADQKPDEDMETFEESKAAQTEAVVEYVPPADHEQEVEQAEGASAPAEPGLNWASEPYSADEFGLEGLGLSRNMALDEVVEILGEPLRIEKHDGMGPHTTLHYEGLALSFDQGLQEYRLSKPGVMGARGIRVGDSVDTVLNSYLQENEVPNLWSNPEAAGVSDVGDNSIELYYFEPDDQGLVKIGILYRDEETAIPVRVSYSHYLPYTCAYSRIVYVIEDETVTAIERTGF